MVAGIVAICLLFQFYCVSNVQAEIFSFVDSQGVIHFSNVPSDSRYKLYQKKVRVGRVYTYRRNNKFQLRNDSYYDRHIYRASLKYGIDFALLKALIKAESNFDRYAVSSKGAEGLMQLMPQTSQLLKIKNPFNPAENIFGGTHYLRMLLDQFNDNLIFALAAYNAGPQTVSYYGGIPPFSETENYVKRVLKYFQEYKLTLSKR